MLSRPADRGEDGFTLVELLIASAASIGLLIGLVTLMATVLQATGQANARVAATRQTRVALAQLENELHSACVGTGSTQNLSPIQVGSTGSILQFVSYTGTAINPTPMWHTVIFNSSAGTLTDNSYTVTGSAGNWTPATTQPSSSTILLANVAQQGSTPIFQYFAYQATTAPDGNDYWTIPDGIDTLPNGTTPAAAPLSVTPTTAPTIVEVLVTLSGGPSGATTGSATNPVYDDPETDAISLRLTTPPDEAPSTAASSYGPCE